MEDLLIGGISHRKVPDHSAAMVFAMHMALTDPDLESGNAREQVVLVTLRLTVGTGRGVGWGIYLEGGVEWSGVEWSEVVWSGAVWSGVVWCDVEWNGMEWSGAEWSGVGGSGVLWCGLERSGVEWCRVEWCGVEWRGVVCCGAVWSGVVWSGVVGYLRICHLLPATYY